MCIGIKKIVNFFVIFHRRIYFIKTTINEQLKLHSLYVKSLGREGIKLILDEANFEKSKLENTDLTEASLTECVFDEMNIKGTDFFRTELYSSSFKKTNIISVNFAKAKADFVSFKQAKIDKTNFLKADLPESDFSFSIIKDSSFIASDLRETDFSHATLTKADFEFANIEETIFKDVVFKNIINLDKAMVESINIGSLEEPVILEKEEACNWLLDCNDR